MSERSIPYSSACLITIFNKCDGCEEDGVSLCLKM